MRRVLGAEELPGHVSLLHSHRERDVLTRKSFRYLDEVKSVRPSHPPSVFSLHLVSFQLEDVLLLTLNQQEFQLISTVQKDTPGVLERLTDENREQNSAKTDMDAAALFETTVLHELTHSKAVGIPQQHMGISEVFGWAGCVDVKNPNNSGTCCLPTLILLRFSDLYNALFERKHRKMNWQ